MEIDRFVKKNAQKNANTDLCLESASLYEAEEK